MDNQMLNRSLLSPLWGAAVVFILGLLLAHYFVLGWVDNTWPILLAKLVIGIGVAVTYYALCIQPATLVGYRGVVKLLGKRIRMGPVNADGVSMGFQEGVNATPLPSGLMTVKDEDMRERTMDLGRIDEFTTNDVVATADSSANWRVLDPYIWQSIEDGTKTLENILKQTFRDEMMLHRSHATRRRTKTGIGAILKPGIIDEDKNAFSNRVKEKVRERLELSRTDKAKTTLLDDSVVEVVSIQVRMIDLPIEIKSVLIQRENEPIERAVEHTQAQSRRQQVDILTAPDKDGNPSTIDQRLAYMGSLSDADKKGVNMTHFSADATLVSSLTSVLTAALGNFFRNQTPPAPPPPTTGP